MDGISVKWMVWGIVTAVFIASDLWMATEASSEHEKSRQGGKARVTAFEKVFWAYSAAGTLTLIVSAAILGAG